MRWLRDYGWIALAFAGIFCCGFMAGRRTIPSGPPVAPAVRLDDGRWEAAAFEMLDRELALRDDQRALVRAALADSRDSLRDVRDAALADSKGILIDLIDRISPGLDPDQRKILDRDRFRLQKELIRNGSSDGGSYPFRGPEKNLPNP